MSKPWPFDDATMESIRRAMEEVTTENEMSSEAFWDSLSYEDKCNAFQAVVSRIHKGELVEGRSYRGMLYDVFGFKEDMYDRGMDCGYMDLHNSIMVQEIRKNLTFPVHSDPIVKNMGENVD